MRLCSCSPLSNRSTFISPNCELPEVCDHYRKLLSLRRTLPRDVRVETDGQTLRMRRGNATLVVDFTAKSVELSE